ncbi:MAG: 50S ribosomal protein L30 [Clostridia bacterium]|nr:50S ribosomal protein L30 [Clostridia bacterium]
MSTRLKARRRIMAKIKVTLVKSTIGALVKQKANVAALGLKKIGKSKIHEDNAVIRGMINVVNHLVKVESVD